MIIKIILFMLCGVGITNLVVNATILDFLRKFLISLPKKIQKYFKILSTLNCKRMQNFIKKLLDCMMCSGFWVGLFISIFFGINPIVGAIIISLLGDFYNKISDTLNAVYDYCVVNAEENDEEDGESN